jgi:hypothetical protein
MYAAWRDLANACKRAKTRVDCQSLVSDAIADARKPITYRRIEVFTWPDGTVNPENHSVLTHPHDIWLDGLQDREWVEGNNVKITAGEPGFPAEIEYTYPVQYYGRPASVHVRYIRES